LYDPVLFSLVALVVSISSIAILIMKEGVGLILGYRESPETSRRRREIDSKLRAEVRKEEQKFLLSVTEKEGERDEEKELESLMELGRSAFFARAMCENLLDDITRYMHLALSYLSVGLLVFFFTLYIGVNTDFSTSNSYVVFIIFVAITFFVFYQTYKQLRNHYLLRERFVRLSENANLEYCRELGEELENEGLWS
jgi:hypothetical protein